MKSYQHIEDFLSDSSFKQWVLKGDAAQRERWEQWQLDNPEKVPLLLQARIILLELDGPDVQWDEKRKRQVFAKISAKIETKGQETKSPPAYKRFHLPAEKWARVAIFTFLLAAAFVVFLQWEFWGAGSDPDVPKQPEWVVKSNPPGQKSTVHLPDGSSLVLNSDSEVRFQRDFGKTQRDLYLIGESFFEVSPDSLPFRVISGELVTEALGTAFNINAYGEETVQVQLASGEVKVYKEKEADQPVYLVPGEEVLMGADQILQKKEFDLDKAFRWKEGILSFNQTPYSVLVLTLERWYGVQIRTRNPPAGQILISGEFRDTYLASVLESLGYAYGFTYKINNKEVEIIFHQKESL